MKFCSIRDVLSSVFLKLHSSDMELTLLYSQILEYVQPSRQLM